MRLPFLRPRESQAERSRAAPAPDEPTAIAAARTRARQRLVGALVLLVIGVVGFPILFETQPRPLPLNTPIVLPGAATPAAANPAPQPAVTAPPVLPPADAGIEPTPAAVPAPEPARVAPAASATVRAAAPAASVPVRAAAPPASAVVGEPASAAKASRFVVQVGAFSDANALREVRQKVEKLGYKTYTQDIVVDGGKRTRVRVGPYETRDEADAAAAKLKRAGLGPAVLAL